MLDTFLSRPRWIALAVVSLLASASLHAAFVSEYKSGIVWPEPPIVSPGETAADPPSDAIVLFDGGDLDEFHGGDKWVVQDGYAIARGGGLTSKREFGDCQIHLEFATPEEVKGKGQGRGNSGLYLMGRYEVQILDSFENTTYFDGQCGAIYKQQPPTVNASRGPGEWQTYDVIFTAPRFREDGSVEQPAFVTVLHNGVLIHNHFELQGSTSYVEAPKYSKHPERLPLNIQFHGNPVRFRNIWVRENIQPLVGEPPAEETENQPQLQKPSAESTPGEKPEPNAADKDKSDDSDSA
ncbi:MAG: DUF1080 domain-containing protein [Pirellulaceae bacterium]|nr:DUF1080 domain-containing protein [Planctomycetales bacterium]